MAIEFLIGQLFLALFNVANSHIDAYRIMSNKTIAHGVNFITYALFVALLCFLLHMLIWWPAILFAISAFLNRQFSFDIMLNLRRGLSWDYQTKAVGKKASLLDRIERALFGASENVGKIIFAFYLGAYVAINISFVIVYG